MGSRLNARARAHPVAGIILMTDDRISTDWVDAVRALPTGSAVIVRHRGACERERLARALVPVCQRRRVLLLIAEDFKLARRLRVDGVHVPERLVGSVPGLRRPDARWIITTSVHSAGALRRAALVKPDVILVSPLFSTASHAGASSLGTIRFAGIVSRCRVPVYALGGIDVSNASRVALLPVQGIALIRGWLGSEAARS